MHDRRNLVLADTHVHIHECFDLESVLDAASANFVESARGFRDCDLVAGVLFLTEMPGAKAFETLSDWKSTTGWFSRRTEEKCSLIVERGDGLPIVVVAGQQIVSSEGLEVLALGTTDRFESARPARETLEQVASCGAMAVLPWGFGKWIGERGALVATLLGESEAESCPAFFLGDNGGRPSIWGEPRLFGHLGQRKGHILPGTDALPIDSEYRRPGSFGLGLEAQIDLGSPYRALKRAMDHPDTAIRPYGKLENPLRFLRNQLLMQLRKRSSG